MGNKHTEVPGDTWGERAEPDALATTTTIAFQVHPDTLAVSPVDPLASEPPVRSTSSHACFLCLCRVARRMGAGCELCVGGPVWMGDVKEKGNMSVRSFDVLTRCKFWHGLDCRLSSWINWFWFRKAFERTMGRLRTLPDQPEQVPIYQIIGIARRACIANA